RVLGRRQRVEQDVQREQHQAKPDRHPSETLDPDSRADAESDQADDEEHRATAATLNDSTWTMRVVPTFAPSMIASAGTRATRPSPANEAVISPVAVLLCSTAVSPSPAAKAVKRLPSAVDSRCRSSE